PHRVSATGHPIKPVRPRSTGAGGLRTPPGGLAVAGPGLPDRPVPFSSRWGDAAARLEADRDGVGQGPGSRVPAIPAWEVTMTSATNQRASGAGGRHAEGRGYGLILFASVLLLVVGFFNLIYGIAALANLRTWGWITLIIGVLQLIAAAGVLAGNQLARWFAVAVLALNAIDMMFFVPAYPFWALTIIAMDVVALYGLCAYASRQNLEAV